MWDNLECELVLWDTDLEPRNEREVVGSSLRLFGCVPSRFLSFLVQCHFVLLCCLFVLTGFSQFSHFGVCVCSNQLC